MDHALVTPAQRRGDDDYVPLAQLRQNGLPDDASMEMHEDFVEWSGWQRTREEASQTLASLQHLLEKPLAPATAS